MSPQHRTFARLTPFAVALSLALLVPAGARAQAGTGAAAPEAGAATEIPLTAADRQQFVGTYLLSMPGSAARSMPFRVYEERDALHGAPQGGSPKRLVHLGRNRFHPEGEPESVVTFTVKEGKATRFTVSTPQGAIEAVRESRAEES